MASAELVLKVTASRDWVRLAAYEYALKEIARRGTVPAWERDDDEPEAHELAEAALRAMGDWDGDK